MPGNTTISISILDKDYQVSCLPEEVTALKRSADYLDARFREMKENSSLVSFDRLAVMAALNIANDLLIQTEKAEKLDAQESALKELAGKVDSALVRLKGTGKLFFPQE